MSESRSRPGKRELDLAVAIPAAVLLSPLFITIAVWIKLDSRGPVFFLREGVGQFGRLFRIFKFRSMIVGAGADGPRITVSGDRRVTRSGRLLRILGLKPGLTGTASIAFSDESETLSRQHVPEAFYRSHLIPAKISEDLSYARRATVFSDCAMVVKTLFRIFG